MADDPVPADVREFVLAHIDSIAQLEALLLLHGRTQPEWSVAEVAERLYITEEQVTVSGPAATVMSPRITTCLPPP